ncbi:MAG: hypothetical protein ACRENP_28695 [Longimicrobiales bacterium]
MRIRNLALALLIVPGTLAAQASPINPTCKADRTGDRLLTSVEYPNGYRIDAPWVVVDQRTEAANGNSAIVVTAILDRIIEYDPVTREQNVTPFPSAVEVVFEANSPEEVLQAAAKVWCSTVAKVRNGKSDSRNGGAPVRVTSVRTTSRWGA